MITQLSFCKSRQESAQDNVMTPINRDDSAHTQLQGTSDGSYCILISFTPLSWIEIRWCLIFPLSILTKLVFLETLENVLIHLFQSSIWLLNTIHGFCFLKNYWKTFLKAPQKNVLSRNTLKKSMKNECLPIFSRAVKNFSHFLPKIVVLSFWKQVRS